MKGAGSKAASGHSAHVLDTLPPPCTSSLHLPLTRCETVSPLHVACQRGDVGVVRRLLIPAAAGAGDSCGVAGGDDDRESVPAGAGAHKLWEVTDDWYSVFHAAAAGGVVEVLRLVCAAVFGAEGEAGAKDGAAQEAGPEVQRLLQQLLLIKTCSQGHTCLMTACARGHFAMAAELSSVGGIELVRARDNAGKTCLDHVPRSAAQVADGSSGGSGSKVGGGRDDKDSEEESVIRGCALVARSLQVLDELENTAPWGSAGAAARSQPQEQSILQLNERLKLAKKEAKAQQRALTSKTKALQTLRDKCGRLDAERATLQELPAQREALLQEIGHLSSTLADLEHRERKEGPSGSPGDGCIGARPGSGAGRLEERDLSSRRGGGVSSRSRSTQEMDVKNSKAEADVGAAACGYAGACDAVPGPEGDGVGAPGLAEVETAVLCEECREREPVVALVPCGHVCVCETCAAKFGAGGSGCCPTGQARCCPICQGEVVECLRIFLS